MQANSPRERILLAAHDLFYRHFPSKNDLIRKFLEYRHLLWMARPNSVAHCPPW